MTTETIETVQRRPQYVEEREQLVLDKIFGTPTTGDDGTVTYTGGLIDASEYPDLFKIPEYKLAGQTDLERSVQNTFATPEQRDQFMNRYQPYFTDASGQPRYLGEASGALGGGYGQITGAINDYFPTARDYVSGGRGAVDARGIYGDELSGARSRADQGTQSFDARGRASDLFSDAQQTVKGGLGSFDPSESVSKFMDPYKQQVIDEAMKQIDRQGAETMAINNANAVGAGAFGGSRAGVQAAETSRGISETKNKTISDMLSAGYQQSLSNAYTADEASKNRALTAGQRLGGFGSAALGAESSAFEGAEGRILKGADLYRSMGLSSADAQAKALSDEKTRSLEAGRLYGGLGQTVGGFGGQMADIGSAYGSLAGTGADIGRVYGAMAPADMGFMYGLGGDQRGYDQSYYDNQRRNAMRGTEQALYPINYAYGALSGTPSAGVYNSYQTNPVAQNNPVVSGFGAYTAMQGVNQGN